MRNLHELDRHRKRTPAVIKHYGSVGDHTAGVFEFPSNTQPGVSLFCVASNGEGWDHVSVTAWRAGKPQTPRWLEMEQVKRMFWQPWEVAMQLHVAAGDHISVHHHCLHIFRPHALEIPLPPKWMVA